MKRIKTKIKMRRKPISLPRQFQKKWKEQERKMQRLKKRHKQILKSLVATEKKIKQMRLKGKRK